MLYLSYLFDKLAKYITKFKLEPLSASFNYNHNNLKLMFHKTKANSDCNIFHKFSKILIN